MLWFALRISGFALVNSQWLESVPRPLRLGLTKLNHAKPGVKQCVAGIHANII